MLRSVMRAPVWIVVLGAALSGCAPGAGADLPGLVHHRPGEADTGSVAGTPDSGADDTGSAADGAISVDVRPYGPDLPLTLVFDVEAAGLRSAALWLEADGETLGPYTATGDGAATIFAWGFPPETPVSARVVVTDADGGTREGAREARIPAVSALFPLPTGGPAPGAAPLDGALLLSVMAPGPGGTEPPPGHVLLVDGRGRVRWAARTHQSLPSRVRVEADGDGVVLLGNIIETVGTDGARAVVSGAAHHDFVEPEPGVYAVLVQEPVTDETGAVVDTTDRLVERTADGRERVVFSVSAHLDALGLVPGEPRRQGLDLTHANALAFVPERGVYLISLTSLPAVIAVDRQTGALRGVVDLRGRVGGGYVGVEKPAFAHEIVPYDGGFYWFVNETTESTCAGILQVEWGYDGGAAVGDMVVRDPDCSRSFVYGGVIDTPSGLLATYATSGEVVLHTPTGAVAWELHVPFGAVLGYGAWLPSVHALR